MRPAHVIATLQEHRRVSDSGSGWAVATILVVDLPRGDVDVPFGVDPGVELDAVGDRLGLAAPGERLELRGEWDRSKYGLQLKVTEQVSQGITDPDDACRWLERLDGVGPKLARALHKHFGERLPAILAGREEADLTEVHGIGADTASHIRDSFAELAIAGDLESIRYLDEVGATRWEATKIMQWCARKRRRPVDVLQKAPYDLMDVKGLGFKKVDRLARKAGCAPQAPARIEAAALHQLEEIVQRGSTMVPMFASRTGGLVGEVLELLGLDDKAIPANAVRRLAAAGRVVLVDENGKTWVHPAELLKAERVIYRAAAKGKTPKAGEGVPGQFPPPSPPPLPEVSSVADPLARVLSRIPGQYTVEDW